MDKKYMIHGVYWDGQKTTNIFAECDKLHQAKNYALQQSLRYVGTAIFLTTLEDNKVANESIYYNGSIYYRKKEGARNEYNQEKNY